jgi:hypothetical protein
MCQGNFGDILESFQKALFVRSKCLPQNHLYIVVSLRRQGTAFFALEKCYGAFQSFEIALGMCPAEDANRAKILNNMCVIHY